MDEHRRFKRVFTLVTTTALLVLALASPARASGAVEQRPPATASLPGVSLGISTYKVQWDLDAKQSFPNRPKSVIGKQPLPGNTSKQLDIVAK